MSRILFASIVTAIVGVGALCPPAHAMQMHSPSLGCAATYGLS
jgi:hypothetical protein